MICSYCGENGNAQLKSAGTANCPLGVWLCKKCFDLPLKMFRIDVAWTELATVEIVALSKGDARSIIHNGPLPDGTPCSGSLTIDHNEEIPMSPPEQKTYAMPLTTIKEENIVRDPKSPPFNVKGVRTGRWPSDKPNLSNPPRGLEEQQSKKPDPPEEWTGDE